nr:hypothetical protein GCM10020092_027120 [Actinoplanes digitatis]
MNHSHPFRRLGALALIAVAALTLTSACSDDKADAPRQQRRRGRTRRPGAQDHRGRQDRRADRVRPLQRRRLQPAPGRATPRLSKKAISKDDYVKLNTACSRKGLAIQLTSARMDGADRAIVIAKQLVAAQSYTMVYEGDAWKLEPAKEGLALYAQGADKAIAAQKKAGTCANA